MAEQRFKTSRFIEHAERSYGRLRGTTLRKTGLEDLIGRATRRNLDVLRDNMNGRDFEAFKKDKTPEAVWKEVKARDLVSDPRAKELITMSLGNPSAYGGYPPNADLYECLAEICKDPKRIQESSGYTTSFGYPPLLAKMQRANFYNPESIRNDPELYSDVKVYLTTGSSAGVELALGPTLLAKEDTLLVPDWTYVIHLAAAYKRGAHVENWELGNDGRPDPKSFQEKLMEEERQDRCIQSVVLTPIGNPIGAAMTADDVVRHLEIVQQAMDKYKRPILAMIDVAYEPFRRDGKPLDIIRIAKEKGIKVPIAVLDTTSKGYGLCGWRMGRLAIYWPEDVYRDLREDYFKCLEYVILPTLGHVAVPMQMAFDMFFERLQSDPATMERTKQFFLGRRERINTNLMHIAQELSRTDGIYLSRYYDHGGRIEGLDPDSLSSFYLLFGFSKLGTREGPDFNQAVAFGGYALEAPGKPIINCVPGKSFLPDKRVAKHQGLIRITGLTDKDETEAFLEVAKAFAKHLG